MNEDAHSASIRDGSNTSCLFCKKPLPSTTSLGEHLIVCGNKTDQCPVCKRFIRRAIFAYHYENNCAKLDDPTRSNRSKPNSSNIDHTNLSSANEDHSHNKVFYLPCQICDAPINSIHFTQHQETCNKQRKTSEQRNRYVNQNFAPQFQCLRCGQQCKDQQDQRNHQIDCTQKHGKKSYAAAVAGKPHPWSAT